MYIKNLYLKNYRNYKETNITFDPKVNIFYGNNAEGKTNLLEAIFICATSKSYKGSKEKEIINFDEENSHIQLTYILEKENIIDIYINKENKKEIYINKVKIEKLSSFLGLFSTVLFAPEDLEIITKGPSERRRYLNNEICQIDKIYISLLANYNKSLNQRNALLKDIKGSFGENKKELINFLSSYDEEIINYGAEIIKKRRENIEDLSKKVKNIYGKISSEKEELIIDYESDILEKEKNIQRIKDTYRKELEESKENDIILGFTNVGPHRDDISFFVKEKDLRKFGSQGQKKTSAICLKLSELMIVKEKRNDTPVLLLDDVFSELDERRQKELVESLDGIQTIITCTGMKRNVFELLRPNKIFRVINNKVEEIINEKH